MTGTAGGTAGGREGRGWARDRSLHQPGARHPLPPQVQGAPLTHVLREAQGGFPGQGVHEEAAHGRLQGGLLGLEAPQSCQETCGDPQPQTGLSLGRGHGICSPPHHALKGQERRVRGGGSQERTEALVVRRPGLRPV